MFIFVENTRNAQLHINELYKVVFGKYDEVDNNSLSIDETGTVCENTCEKEPAIVNTFKNEFKVISRVYKELCEVLVENKKQIKKARKMLVITSKRQKANANNSDVKQSCTDSVLHDKDISNNTTSDIKEHTTETYPTIEIFELSNNTVDENLQELTTSDFDNVIIKIDGQTSRIGEEKKIRCFECFQSFESEAKLIQHCRESSHVSGELYKCDICSATFDVRYKHTKHVMNHGQGRICEICGAQVKAYNMKRHLKEVHYCNKEHICQYCGNSFMQNSVLQNHIAKRHFNKETNKSLCFLCGRTFKVLALLNDHLNRKHASEDLESKMYSCEVCKKYFICRDSLKLHMRFHNSGGISTKRKSENKTAKTRKIYKYKRKCHICMKMFSAPGFKSHMMIHLNIKPFKCSVCLKYFRQKQQLKSHMNIHLNLKPYQCQYCKKHFRQLTNLHVHVRLHTGETPYKCTYCDKGFSHLSAMKKHREIHFKKKRYIEKKQWNNPRKFKPKYAEDSDSE
ncbi:hypothetical protein HHI36_018995 [Cryptolaemus montrouzieri]|uniref:C2H2-type domain-containing protein n=1 Tax=Cryptolaemus montrouzieri TaxID=559131 RepID=A0ABD2P1Y1_9CUCU